MALTDKQSGRVTIISRIYELLTKLTEEQQILLVRQLFREDLPHYLLKVILEMTETQQVTILNELEEIVMEAQSPNGDRVSIVDLDERTAPRKPCIVFVDCQTEEKSFQELIRNISTSGAYIKTNQPIEKGQTLSLSFSIPHTDETIELSGNVVRCDKEGIGVKFQAITEGQRDTIRTFIEARDGE